MAQNESWQPISELLGHLATIAARFVEREIEGAKLEARADLVDLKRAAGRYGLATALGISVLALLIATAVALLAAFFEMMAVPSSLAMGLSALIWAVALAGIVWLLLRQGNTILQGLASRIDSTLGLFAAPIGTQHRGLTKDAADPEEDG